MGGVRYVGEVAEGDEGRGGKETYLPAGEGGE